MSTESLLFVNFEQLRALNRATGDYKASLLFCRLSSQSAHSTIVKDGKKYVARTIIGLAEESGYCENTTAEKLKVLEGFNLIQSYVGMWYGEKRTFIHCKPEMRPRIDIQKMDLLTKYTGGDMQSTMLALFAFFLKKKVYHYKKEDWVIVAVSQVEELFDVCKKTAIAMARSLEEKGIIKLMIRRLWGKSHYIVKINDDFCKQIEQKYTELKESAKEKKRLKELAKKEKSEVSIIINNKEKINIKINNTREAPNSEDKNDVLLADEAGNIILSRKEQNYIGAAVKRTVAKSPSLSWTVEVLISQVKYALSNVQQRKGTQNFVHAVNRAMKLIREGRWKMPFGYEKYNKNGKEEYERMREHEKIHEEMKIKGANTRKEDAPSYGMEYAKSSPCAYMDDKKRSALEDLERRWSEWKYGVA